MADPAGHDAAISVITMRRSERSRSRGTRKTRKEAEEMRDIVLVERGRAGARTTLRQWGDVYLHRVRNHRAFKSERNTWTSVICGASFIDDAVEDLTRPMMFRYATLELPAHPKKRSVLKDGKRTLVTLERMTSPRPVWTARGCAAVDDVALQTRLWSRSPGSGMRSPANAA